VYAVVIPLLFVTDAELAFYSLLPLPALALIGRAFARRMYLLSKEQQEKLGTLSEKVQENLSGVMTVRAYRREALEIRDFDARNDVYNRISLKLAQLRGTMFPLLGMMGGISAIVLLALGGDRIARGAMTVGQFVEFNAYLAALTWPTIALGWMISLWQRGMASMDRINEIFSSAPDLTDGPSSEPIASTAIELRGLTYTYASAVDGIRDITATIEPGQRIAVVGKTGAGKTTLLEAIARVVPVSPGQIFLGGRDVVDLPLSAVRSNISYAPQDAFLFSRSIAENVAFGDPDADDARVAEAVASASFAVDLAAFPDGLDTIVGERGITLSGGQRQRTTLARALLAEAPILILDDTLSAVDTETEAKILDELLERGNGKTIIVATHRLAFAARADLILVLEAGRLVERGTEADLLAKGGVYAEMHARQRIREEILASQRAAPAEDAA
jgi:ATP-binding cassette subfamily B protein